MSWLMPDDGGPAKPCPGFTKRWPGCPWRCCVRWPGPCANTSSCCLPSVGRWTGGCPWASMAPRLACPRSNELETRLGTLGKTQTVPQLWVTAVVHLRLGLLWSWRLGKARASERQHALHMLSCLPKATLLVADAGFNGYDFAATILQHDVSFLIRMSSKVTLLTDQLPSPQANDSVVYYWPEENRQAGQPPLRLRLLRIRGKKKKDVWLLTNVMASKRLSRELAGTCYRWRWENEGLFRTYKRTLKKVKLLCRTVRLVHREAEGALLATQLLLGQGAWAVRPWATRKRSQLPIKCSPRKVLLEIRREIQDCRKPPRRRCFVDRLRQAYDKERPRTSAKAKRPWPNRTVHKPPKPPKLREFNATEKRVLAREGWLITP